MSAQHTPGLWFVTSQNGGSAGCTVWARGGDVAVAECKSTSISLPGRQCDARLIAAAPDLLAALLDVLPLVDSQGQARQSDAIRAAILKATGAQP